MTPTMLGFLLMGVIGLVIFVAYWLHDRAKAPKDPTAESKSHSQPP